ncbi:MAG: hypothetical protein AMXMBFR64_20620 [Myxococcales bacterium]
MEEPVSSVGVDAEGPATPLRVKAVLDAFQGIERLATEQISVIGSTVVHSPVLRVGRSSDKRRAHWAARIKVYGELLDVPAVESTRPKLIQALDQGRTVAARIHARWVRADDESWAIDLAHSRITEVTDSERVQAEPGTWSTLPGVISQSRVAQLLAEEAAEWDG